MIIDYTPWGDVPRPATELHRATQRLHINNVLTGLVEFGMGIVLLGALIWAVTEASK